MESAESLVAVLQVAEPRAEPAAQPWAELQEVQEAVRPAVFQPA